MLYDYCFADGDYESPESDVDYENGRPAFTGVHCCIKSALKDMPTKVIL